MAASKGGAVEDYFLKIDGIPGESRDDKHKDWIELASFSWGLTEPRTGMGAGSRAGRAQFSDFSIVKVVDKASPQLFLSCASGKHIKEAMLSVRQPAPQRMEYLKIIFSNVLVTSFDEAAGADPPHETIGFNFDHIEMTYTPQDATGEPGDPVAGGWDLSKNAKI
jgi:type VI secretion system secreted protein Hcp